MRGFRHGVYMWAIMQSMVLLALHVCCASPTAPSTRHNVYGPADIAPILAFLDADDWVHPLLQQPVGVWLRQMLSGVRVWTGGEYPGAAATVDLSTREIFLRPQNAAQSLTRQASYLIHEARHLDGYAHTCPDKRRDRELGIGTYAVQLMYLEHMADLGAIEDIRANSIGCN